MQFVYIDLHLFISAMVSKMVSVLITFTGVELTPRKLCSHEA